MPTPSYKKRTRFKIVNILTISKYWFLLLKKYKNNLDLASDSNPGPFNHGAGTLLPMPAWDRKIYEWFYHNDKRQIKETWLWIIYCTYYAYEQLIFFRLAFVWLFLRQYVFCRLSYWRCPSILILIEAICEVLICFFGFVWFFWQLYVFWSIISFQSSSVLCRLEARSQGVPSQACYL